MTRKQMTTGTIYPGIDVMKFVMAMMVVAAHVPPFPSGTFLFQVMAVVDRLAVPYFFMATGFLLFCKMDLPRMDDRRVWNYCKRMTRLYVLWNLVYLPMAVIFIKLSHQVFWSTFLKMFFLQGGFGHLWFLHACLLGILLSAGMYVRRWRFSVMLAVGCFLYVVFLCGMTYHFLYQQLVPEGTSFSAFCGVAEELLGSTRHGLFFAPVFFLLSAYVAQAVQRGRTCLGQRRAGQLFAVFFVAFLAEGFVCEAFGSPRMEGFLFAVPVVYFLFLLSLSWRSSYLAMCKCLRERSMLVYFTHVWVVYFVFRLFDPQRGAALGGQAWTALPPYACYFLTLLGALAVSEFLIRLRTHRLGGWVRYLYQ